MTDSVTEKRRVLGSQPSHRAWEIHMTVYQPSLVGEFESDGRYPGLEDFFPQTNQVEVVDRK